MQTGRCGVLFYAGNRAIAARPDLSHRRMPVNKNRVCAAQPGRTRVSDNPWVLLHCGILPLLNVEQSTSAAVRTRLRPVSK